MVARGVAERLGGHPRGERLTSFTPEGANGLSFTAKYGTVGLTVVQREFIAEGINEAGLSAGLFFFPASGATTPTIRRRAAARSPILQVVAWILTQCASIDEVKEAIASVRVVGLEAASVVHWRLGEPSGRQAVLEIVDGVPRFFENEVGVLTNAPGFEWQLTNLDNYVNLRPGDAAEQRLGGVTLRPLGGNSGFLGIPGDDTPPSRFVRAAFYRNTAPQRATAFDTVLQCFHLLNNFDVPIGIQHPAGSARTFRAPRSGPRPSTSRTVGSTIRRPTIIRSAASTSGKSTSTGCGTAHSLWTRCASSPS